MAWHLSICTWLAQAALGSLLILGAGCLAVRSCRQPVRRLRLIELTLAGCLLVPWLSRLPGLPHWSAGWLALLPESSVPAEPPAAEAADLTSVQAGPLLTASRQPAVAEDGKSASLAVSQTGTSATSTASSPPPPIAATSAPAVAAPEQAVSTSVPLLIVLAYAGVALALGLWWLVGVVELLRLWVGAYPASPAVTDLFRQISSQDARGVQLLVSDRIELPLTFRFWRPVILLPGSLCRSPDAVALRYCLAHEWSHVEQRDLWTWYLATLTQFLFFYQPLLWWLRRQLRLCQDFVADARAAEQAPSTEEYAAYLVGLARRRLGAPAPAALGIGDRRSNLYRRVIMLIQNRQPLERRCFGLWNLGSTLAALILVLLVAGVRLDAGDPPPAKKEDVKKEAPKDSAAKTEKLKALTYTGEVVEVETKKPIEGATVTVRRALYGDPTIPGEKIIQETKHQTDAAGKYTFTIPPEQLAERYLYIELDVSHPKYAPQDHFGYSMAMIQKNEKLGGRPFFEHVELRPGEEISGQVLRPDGKPAAGVKVQAFSKANPGDFREYGSFAEAQTDDKGNFHVVVVKGGEAVFWLLPKDFAPSLHLPRKKRGDLGVFGLKEGVRLTGKAVDVKGKPVAGIYVNADLERQRGGDELSGLNVGNSIRRGALTNERGEFELGPLPPGTYRVKPDEHDYEPSKPGRGPSRPRPLKDVFLPQKVTLKEGQKPEPLEVRAVPHVTIEAHYVDSKGKPTRGHDCFVFGQIDGGFWQTMGRPGADGRFLIRVPHGLTQVQLDLMTNEHGVLRHRKSPNEPLSNRRQVQLGTLNDDVKGIEIVRYVAPILIVKVVARDGAKLKNVQVSADYPEGKNQYGGKLILKNGLNSDVSFEEQEDGRFRSSQLFPDEEVTVTGHAEGYKTASQKLKLREGAQKEITITLEKN